MWLCSVSQLDKKGIKGTAEWSPDEFAMAERLAHSALFGVGNESRERAFRMNITFCIHRAVSAAEMASLPPEWSCAVGGLAGGPVEVLWSKGISHRAASMPCVQPVRQVIDYSRADLWIPLDCGECEPCQARAAIEQKVRNTEVSCSYSGENEANA